MVSWYRSVYVVSSVGSKHSQFIGPTIGDHSCEQIVADSNHGRHSNTSSLQYLNNLGTVLIQEKWKQIIARWRQHISQSHLHLLCLSSHLCEMTDLGCSHGSWGSDMWLMLSSLHRSLRHWRDLSLTLDRCNHENSDELPLNGSSTSVDADNDLTIECFFVMWS